MSRRITTNEWIKMAKHTHGDLYDYSEVNYVNTKTKVNILCFKHGMFKQLPGNHKSGQGCPKCSGGYNYSTHEWVEEVNTIHQGLYDYSKVVYKTCYEEVVIICREHGEFKQKPAYHKKGQGCPRCGIERRSRLKYLSTEEWIRRAELVHGREYSYSKTNYSSSREPVLITCRVHGDFEQKANNHMNGMGCPMCPNRYSGPTDLYVLTNEVQLKVGIAIDHKRRVKELNKRSPFSSKILLVYELPNTPTARAVEKMVHEILEEKQAGFVGFDGASEWFNVDIKEVRDVVEEVLIRQSLPITIKTSNT